MHCYNCFKRVDNKRDVGLQAYNPNSRETSVGNVRRTNGEKIDVRAVILSWLKR